ncbi:gluconate 2-dehydrogenase subunit 3-like protein [Chitinophaga skermanii]|uniref:Gluconate 2-dehydrogenase subunit 3-like protein n=1 Tax=Chitinophaga skermanii TaxID=331697 RepID=A0A327Q2T5_9BACT|nr:gluconate 2-dehydrogenase subunit 3 family protein [Chitinophaga skermanii]RAI98728.1 gluconate 2-dehydrogenase subunit 3-like protein [Chitinophaga skermanii]
MDRRDSLKTLVVGSLSVGAILTACGPNDKDAAKHAKAPLAAGVYGRTPDEEARDEKLKKEEFLTKDEMAVITILADIIIPKDEKSGSATEAGVPEFIEFIVKDQPRYQVPMRGGLRWLNVQSAKRFNKGFAELTAAQQIEIVDDIAYPSLAKPEHTQGVSFFNMMRNLTATGFFTSKIGLKDIGYMGNTPNEWDGVPDDVLKQYNLAYDEKTLKECLKIEERGEIMKWS